jgi:hypothetical protein
VIERGKKDGDRETTGNSTRKRRGKCKAKKERERWWSS